jgi:chaperonin GroEL (HSP60 family)
MLKMLLDPMGGIVLTNDGNAILREVILSQILSYILNRLMLHTPQLRA